MKRILVVEDDSQMREGLEEMLRESRFEVASVPSGTDALSRIREEEFDIVLTDLVMPTLGGMEVLKEIKKKKPHILVIMITGFATIESAVKAIKEGASDYISKPFKIDEVQTTINRVLEEDRFLKASKSYFQSMNNDQKAISPFPLNKDILIKALSNPIRREAVELLLQRGRSRFTDLKKEMRIEDATKLSFHLRELKSAGLIEQNAERLYSLSLTGKEVAKTLIQLEEKMSRGSES